MHALTLCACNRRHNDYGWNNKIATTYGLYGGNCGSGAHNGTFYFHLNDPIIRSYWDFGANEPVGTGYGIEQVDIERPIRDPAITRTAKESEARASLEIESIVIVYQT